MLKTSKVKVDPIIKTKCVISALGYFILIYYNNLIILKMLVYARVITSNQKKSFFILSETLRKENN